MINLEMPKLESKIITIPENEITENFSRSGGAGGQNVNKVSTKVELRWSPIKSMVLSDSEKQLLLEVLKNRLNQRGEIIVVCQEARTQGQNRVLAFEKLQQLITKALQVDKERIATKPSFSVREQRLETKKKISQKKSERRTPDLE